MEPQTKKALEDLRKHVREERDFNETWISLHLRDGHSAAAERRREVVTERNGWLAALDDVLGVDPDAALKVNTHKLGTCLRFANGETCVGFGDPRNHDPLTAVENAPNVGRTA